MKIWIDTSRLDGCQCEAELRYEKTSIYQTSNNRGGVLLQFACLDLKAKLTEIANAFEVAVGSEQLPISPETVELVTSVRKRLVPYYSEEKVLKHFRGLSINALAEFLPFIAAHTDEQLKTVCQYSLESLSVMAVPCKVVVRSIDIGCSSKIYGYVSQTPKEQWEPAQDKVSRLTFEIPSEAVIEFFSGDNIREEIKQAQSELDFFTYPMPLILSSGRMKYLECVDLDTFFQIAKNRASNVLALIERELVRTIEMQDTAKRLIQSELSEEYGALFPWDLKPNSNASTRP